MKVRITNEAEANLEDIADYIAKDSPGRAVTFAAELVEASLAIGDQPKAYPLIPRYEHYGYRRRPYGAYLIIYTIEAEWVEIKHILHASRNYEALLFPDPK